VAPSCPEPGAPEPFAPVVPDAADPAADFGGAAADVAASTTRFVALMRSLATDLPAAAAPLNTPIALFMKPMVSAIVVALTFPARSFSSTASANRPRGFGV